jgi:uncharacterized protein (TIGR03067 family)
MLIAIFIPLTNPVLAVLAEPPDLRGTWIIQSIERDPPEKAPNEGRGIKCVISRDRIRLEVPGENASNGSLLYRIDARQRPNRIDVWTIEPDSGKKVDEVLKEKPIEGIYELTEEKLVVCFSSTGISRPDDFTVKPGSRRVLIELRRSKR